MGPTLATNVPLVIYPPTFVGTPFLASAHPITPPRTQRRPVGSPAAYL